METSINNKCKAFTSLEQSKKLAKILPIESADMFYTSLNRDYPWIWIDKHLMEVDDIPCWSLSALLEIIPKDIDCSMVICRGGYDAARDEMTQDYVVDWNREYTTEHEASRFITRSSNLLDAAFEMIVKLHDLNIL